MRIGRTVSVTLLAGVCSATSPAFSQNFRGDAPSLVGSVGAGARAMGMGGAFVAIADDATAASWNPAGLCVLEKPEASVAYKPIQSSREEYAAYTLSNLFPAEAPASFWTTGQAARTRATSFRALDFASATLPVRLGSLKLVPQISYQRVADLSRHGADSAITTNSTGPYRGAPTTTIVDTLYSEAEASGGLDVMTGSLGLSFNSRLFLGVSVNRWMNGVGDDGINDRRTTTTDAQGSRTSTTVREFRLEEDYSGTNFVAGVLLKPSQKLRFGAVWKSGFDLRRDYTRKGKTAFLDGAPTTLGDIQRSSIINWPSTWAAGISVQPTQSLTFSVDYTRTAWSKARNQFTASMSQGVPETPPATTFWPVIESVGNPGLPESAANPYANDTAQARLGIEYVITRAGFANLTALPLRAGVFRDQQLVKNTPDLGSTSFLGFSAGFGLVWSRLSVDVAYVRSQGEWTSHAYDLTVNDSTVGTYRAIGSQDGKNKYSSDRIWISSTVRF